MALPVLANKLFTEKHGVMNKEWLPPYELPPTLDEQEKMHLKTNDERISEHWSWKSASVPKLPPVPPRSSEPPDAKNIHATPPHIQNVKDVRDAVLWSKPTFP